MPAETEMGLASIVWANALREISPLAKLIAIDFAHVSGFEEIGTRTLEDLADFACCDPDEAEVALIELSGVVAIERTGDLVRASFPTRVDQQNRRERYRLEAKRHERRQHHLYVICKGGRVKIGISGQLDRRLAALHASFPIEMEVLLTADGPYRAIRSAEVRAHERLQHCALGGEYFDTVPTVAVEVTKLALAEFGIAANDKLP